MVLARLELRIRPTPAGRKKHKHVERVFLGKERKGKVL